jgi:hypothetical protein
MKAVLFLAFLALIPALADRLSGPRAPSPSASAEVAAIADDRDDRITRASGEQWPWLCGTRS